MMLIMIRNIVLVMILILFSVKASIDPCKEKCLQELENPKWRLVYENDAAGKRVSGSKSELVKAALSGASVRIGTGNNYFTAAQNVLVHDGNTTVSAELLNHVSKSSWNRMQANTYWWFVILDTNGNFHMTRYYVGGKFLSATEKKIGVKWFIKIINCGTPTYSHDENLLSGSSLLANSVRQGFDIRTVSKANNLISVIPLNNVRVSLNTVYGQNVDALSKEISKNQVVYKSNAFRVFTMFSSKNTITREYWDLVAHRSHGYSKKTSSVDWFADTQWKQVYAHTKSGFPLCGSLDKLLSAILGGRRVRFQLPDSSVYTAEADNLHIRNGHVTAQALKLVGEKGETDFDKKGIWEWLMVSTTGTIKTTRYQVGRHKHVGDSSEKQAIVWFVDTGRWNLALETDSSGNPIKGKKKGLIKAIRNGSAVRCVTMDGTYAFSAQNLAINKKSTNVAAQTINTISVRRSSSDLREVEIQPNAYWWFTIVDTTGRREMSRWNVGEHKSRGHTEDKVGHKWFVNE